MASEIPDSRDPFSVWDSSPDHDSCNDGWDTHLPPAVSASRGGSFSRLLERADPSSILSTVGSFTVSMGKGLARIVGGVIATAGAAASLLPQAAVMLSALAGKFAGAAAGGVVGFVVGVVRGNLHYTSKGIQMGGNAGGLLCGGVAAIALSIPYLLTICITDIGTNIMQAGGASHSTAEKFHGISERLYREIVVALRPQPINFYQHYNM